jgi:hypothetical protein
MAAVVSGCASPTVVAALTGELPAALGTAAVSAAGGGADGAALAACLTGTTTPLLTGALAGCEAGADGFAVLATTCAGGLARGGGGVLSQSSPNSTLVTDTTNTTM